MPADQDRAERDRQIAAEHLLVVIGEDALGQLLGIALAHPDGGGDHEHRLPPEEEEHTGEQQVERQQKGDPDDRRVEGHRQPPHRRPGHVGQVSPEVVGPVVVQRRRDRQVGGRGVEIVQAVDHIDRAGGDEADPEEAAAPQRGARLGEGQRKLDDREAQALAVGPLRPHEHRQADHHEDPDGDEAGPAERRCQPGANHRPLVEGGGAVVVAVEHLDVGDHQPERGAGEHLIPPVLGGGEPEPMGHHRDEHLHAVEPGQRGADGEHHVHDDHLALVERQAGREAARGGIGEGEEEEDEDDVEEERDGRGNRAVGADSLHVEHPHGVERHEHRAHEEAAPDAAVAVHSGCAVAVDSG